MQLKICIIVFLSAFSIVAGDNDPAFTSPVLKKTRTNYLNFAGKTYYVGNVFRANFFRSMQFCRQLGMQLVSITSPAENSRLERFITEIGSPRGHFWTSGTNIGDHGQWIWLSTGDNMVYSNWHEGEPNGLTPQKANQSENCIEARNFGKGFTRNDLNCFAELYFICELSSSSCGLK